MQKLTISSESVTRTSVNKDGNPLTRSRTLKLPVAFRNEEDAAWLIKVASVTRETMNHVLGILRDRFFEPLAVTLPDGTARNITLFDIFDADSGLEGPFTYDGKTGNKSITEHPVREIFNSKCPLAGKVTADVVSFMEGLLPEGTDVKVKFVTESIYSRVQGMVINAVSKKLNNVGGNARRDRTWQKCCREAADGDRTMAIQLEILGFQSMAVNNGGVPSLDKWPETVRTVAKPELSGKFLEAYGKACGLFREAFAESFPEIRRQSLLYCPAIKLDWDSRDSSLFYDVPGKIERIPSIGNRVSVDVRVRTVSGHSDSYFPEDLAGCLKNEPVIGLRFPENPEAASLCSPDGSHATGCPVSCHVAASLPLVKTSLNKDSMRLDEGVGIDLNVAAFFMNTSLPLSEAVDAVDWPEAVRTFRSECPTAYPFTMPYRRAVNDLNSMADHAGDSGRMLEVIPLVGLRDGRPSDAAHGWKGSPDPLSTLFSWMLRRTGKDGKPFYTEGQRSQIGHTRDFRKLVRSETANRLHYFDEQSRWDLSHDGRKEPFAESETGKALLAERAGIRARIEKEFVRLAVTGLIDNVAEGRIQYLKMEDVDLSEVKDDASAKSLWGTARDVWGMGDGKLSCKNGAVEFVTECPFNLEAVKSTEYWTVKSAVRDGDIVKISAEPTGKYVEENTRHWIDAYTHRALHFSSVKALVEELCVKRGIHFALTRPEYTSKVCNACRSTEHINFKGSATEKLSREQCLARYVNYRMGRVFVCGNPECAMYGVEQNADCNAAHNVQLPDIKVKRIRTRRSAA